MGYIFYKFATKPVFNILFRAIMKRLAILFFLVISVASAQESYYVVHIKGNILNQSTGKTLKVGDKVNATDKVKFNPEQAAAVVMSAQAGRFSLGRPQNTKPGVGGEFLAFVKNTMLPMKSNGQLSTRSARETVITDLKGTIGAETFVFPDNTAKLVLSPAMYPMSAQKCFVYRYMYQNKTVSKRILFSGDTLLIDKKSLYVVGGQPVMPKDASETVDIFYYDIKNNTSVKIVTFKPVFLDEKELKAELEAVMKMFVNRNLSRDEMIDIFYDHVTSVHGRTDKTMLSQWVKEKLKL
jgi:hypothetical protein